MTDKEKISIIVPVYNVEKYLEKCVSSVLEQTFSDFELILVDDKSPDSSGLICDALSKKDTRIRVIHREQNGGLSAARNSGIEVMQGEYVLFLDSDDFLHREALSSVYNAIIENNADIAVMSPVSVTDDENEAPDTEEAEASLLSGVDALLNRNKESTSAWGKLFKSEFFENTRFIEGYWHEDVHMSTRLFTKENVKVVFVNKKLYCYRQNPQSFMRSKMSPKRIDDALFIFEDSVNYMRGLGNHELITLAGRKHVYMAKDCYFGAKDIGDKARMKKAHESFRRVYKTLDKAGLDKHTKRLFNTFCNIPCVYTLYEKAYWLVEGVFSKIFG